MKQKKLIVITEELSKIFGKLSVFIDEENFTEIAEQSYQANKKIIYDEIKRDGLDDIFLDFWYTRGLKLYRYDYLGEKQVVDFSDVAVYAEDLEKDSYKLHIFIRINNPLLKDKSSEHFNKDVYSAGYITMKLLAKCDKEPTSLFDYKEHESKYCSINGFGMMDRTLHDFSNPTFMLFVNDYGEKCRGLYYDHFKKEHEYSRFLTPVSDPIIFEEDGKNYDVWIQVKEEHYDDGENLLKREWKTIKETFKKRSDVLFINRLMKHGFNIKDLAYFKEYIQMILMNKTLTFKQ